MRIYYISTHKIFQGQVIKNMDVLLKILKGMLLGAVQGFTEFLPVSSSGHLILFEKLGVSAPDLTLNLFLHLSTLAAMAIVLRRDIFALIKKPFSKDALWIVLASIPTAAVAFAVKKFLPEILEGGFLAPCFFLSAVVLLLPRSKKTRDLNSKNALFVGLCQGIAVLPGISRSGTTISALTAVGVPEEKAKRFSFLLSFPVIIGGAIFEIPSASLSIDAVLLIPALVVAFLVGLFSLKVMLKVFSSRNALPFSLYLFALAALSAYLSL